MNIRIVCATREKTQEAFFLHTQTGKSLSKQAMPPHLRLTCKLFLNNSAGLPACYNAAIEEETEPDTIFVFVHDDVTFADYFWPETLVRCLQRFDVVGLAGNVRRVPNQGGWWSTSPAFESADHGKLSGAVGQGQNYPPYRVDVFGPVEQEVKLLDGLFLAVPAPKLTESGSKVRFDERFAFHHYDLDFCRQCERVGLRMGTVPITVVHASPGSPFTDAWRQSYEKYLEKWKE